MTQAHLAAALCATIKANPQALANNGPLALKAMWDYLQDIDLYWGTAGLHLATCYPLGAIRRYMGQPVVIRMHRPEFYEVEIVELDGTAGLIAASQLDQLKPAHEGDEEQYRQALVDACRDLGLARIMDALAAELNANPEAF